MTSNDRARALVAACYDKSCAPPPVGKGGSEPGHTHGAGTKEDPIVTNDIRVAAEALGQDKFVVLNQPKKISTLLDRLAKMANEARQSGREEKVYNLCRVSVPGTNLFCAESKGIPRIHMPQLVTRHPVPGSPASRIKPGPNGEIDLGPSFVAYLRTRGVKVSHVTADPAYLKASQGELRGGKVGAIMRQMEKSPTGQPDNPIFTSSDNYVVDGHHRWAAAVGVNYRPGVKMTLPTVQIDMPITQLLAEANAFTKRMGAPPQAA